MLVSEASATYLRARRAEGYSPATLKQYTYQLQRFAIWVGPRMVEELRLNDLRNYVADQSHLKAQSLAHVVRVLRAFFFWLLEEEMIPHNPAIKLKEPKMPKAVPKALTFEELELLRDSCRTPLEHALVEFLFATGCRISEVRGVDRDQIEWERRAVAGERAKGARGIFWCTVFLVATSLSGYSM